MMSTIKVSYTETTGLAVINEYDEVGTIWRLASMDHGQAWAYYLAGKSHMDPLPRNWIIV